MSKFGYSVSVVLLKLSLRPPIAEPAREPTASLAILIPALALALTPARVPAADGPIPAAAALPAKVEAVEVADCNADGATTPMGNPVAVEDVGDIPYSE